MARTEGDLRAVFLVSALVLGIVTIGSILFLGNRIVGVIGTLVGLVFGVFGVYTHYFELPDELSDSVHSTEVEDSSTAGTRPEIGEKGFNPTTEDVVLSELSPKRIAQVVHNSPNWHSDGHGSFSTWWRPRLRRIFYSELFSNRTFERVLLLLTVGSFVVSYFVFLSFFPENLTVTFIEPLTEIYPSSQPLWQTQLLLFSTISVGLVGTAYFETKAESTCGVCQSPFSLQSKKRFFKPENRKIITVQNNQHSEQKEVTYGVQTFHCESCGSWTVETDRWEKNLQTDRDLHLSNDT